MQSSEASSTEVPGRERCLGRTELLHGEEVARELAGSTVSSGLNGSATAGSTTTSSATSSKASTPSVVTT